MNNEDKIKLLEEEIEILKEKLKKYTAPKRSKIFYENHKEEIKQKAREYKEKTNYNTNIPKEKKKEYNKIAYQKKKEQMKQTHLTVVSEVPSLFATPTPSAFGYESLQNKNIIISNENI